jgi:hypothetical protein
MLCSTDTTSFSYEDQEEVSDSLLTSNFKPINLSTIKSFDFYGLSSLLFTSFVNAGTISFLETNPTNIFDNKSSSSIRDFMSVKKQIRNDYYSFIKPVKLSEENRIFTNAY